MNEVGEFLSLLDRIQIKNFRNAEKLLNRRNNNEEKINK